MGSEMCIRDSPPPVMSTAAEVAPAATLTRAQADIRLALGQEPRERRRRAAGAFCPAACAYGKCVASAARANRAAAMCALCPPRPAPAARAPAARARRGASIRQRWRPARRRRRASVRRAAQRQGHGAHRRARTFDGLIVTSESVVLRRQGRACRRKVAPARRHRARSVRVRRVPRARRPHFIASSASSTTPLTVASLRRPSVTRIWRSSWSKPPSATPAILQYAR